MKLEIRTTDIGEEIRLEQKVQDRTFEYWGKITKRELDQSVYSPRTFRYLVIRNMRRRLLAGIQDAKDRGVIK